MKWFNRAKSESKPATTVCSGCSVVFVYGCRADTLTNFCFRCAEPHIEKQKRIAVVVSWASENWEVLESLALEDQKKKKLSNDDVGGKRLADLIRQQQNTYSACQSTFGPWDRKLGIM